MSSLKRVWVWFLGQGRSPDWPKTNTQKNGLVPNQINIHESAKSCQSHTLMGMMRRWWWRQFCSPHWSRIHQANRFYCSKCLYVHTQSFSHVWLFSTLWTVAHQALLSMRFSRQEYWSGLSFPSPGDLPNPGIELNSLKSPEFADRIFTITWPGKLTILSPQF